MTERSERMSEEASCHLVLACARSLWLPIFPFFLCPLVGVSLEIGNFCTLSALFNQSWFVRG
ncbi:hypothetical protein AL476_000045 [Klebsiella pneumoniae]|nr:hypothetical protein AL476_000045 [Klebsiella pneumoniae]